MTWPWSGRAEAQALERANLQLKARCEELERRVDELSAKLSALAAPPAEPTPAPVPPVAPVVGVEGKPLVLVAEDDAPLRGTIARCLADEFEVLEAADGRAALDLARERLPDVILSDVMMPGMDGVELCRAVKADATTLATPFVVLTALGDMEARLTGLRRGADDYLVKPFEPEELRARLRAQVRMRHLSRQLAQSEKLAALGTLVAGVAHEVRNPLNGIINSLGPLKESLAEAPAAVTELLDLAIESSRRVERISGQLLRQARAGEGERALVDVSENVAFAVKMLEHKAQGGPSLSACLPPSEPASVMGEAGALNQVWINLIDNAILAAGRSGHVEVRVSRTGGEVAVEVSDDGPGIEPKLLGRIFNPFFTTRAVGQGTGLGLSMVQEIVRAHGGAIRVESPPGAGARFRVTLPAAEAGPLNGVSAR